MRHEILIRGILIPFIRQDEKTLDIRVGLPTILRIRPHDTIVFMAKRERAEVHVSQIGRYVDFETAVESHCPDRIFPGHTPKEIVTLLRSIYLPGKEKLGVYVFAFRYTGRKPT